MSDATRRSGRIRALIVDDSPGFRRELRVLLELEKVVVVGEAANGWEAVQLNEQLEPDVILMDQNMPALSGVGATREIKRAHSYRRVIFVAAEGAWREEALKAGAEAYFVKGTDLRALFEVIRDPMAGLRSQALPAPPAERPEFGRWIGIVLGTVAGLAVMAGLVLAPSVAIPGLALIFGFFFFLYGLKYYGTNALILIATAGVNGNGNGHGNGNGNGHGRRVALLNGKTNGHGNGGSNEKRNGNGLRGLGLTNGSNGRLKVQPFVSIHLPLYNEREVVDRLLAACTNLDYENYELIVADDSTDETTEILRQRWGSHPRVKIFHRHDRAGFKGGALQQALLKTDPRAQFVVVFDADFLPPPDILHQFLAYFYGVNGNGNGHGHGQKQGDHPANGEGEPRLIDDRVAVVQGYQWHVLNASENWITKGIRSEFSGSYVVERSGQELLGSMKMISGSVFMIRADVLRSNGWGTSITEDWELTLRLYLNGYKVLYTPFIQAPSECVASFKQLARQRMRWAEGHTFNVKKYFWEVLGSHKLSRAEKLEFIYFAPYYLQSAFFMLGTGSWMLSELILKFGLPFWAETLGWALVFANAFSLVLMNLTGLFLERGVKRNWTGLFSFILLTYLLVPYQAYAAIKGLLEPHEGGWHRTQKTGVITEVVDRLSLKKLMRRLAPKKKKPASRLGERLAGLRISRWIPQPVRFLGRRTSLGFRAASGLGTALLLLALLSQGVSVATAAPDAFYLHTTVLNGGEMMNITSGTGAATKLFSTPGQTANWFTELTYPTGNDNASIASGNYTLNMYFSSLPPAGATVKTGTCAIAATTASAGCTISPALSATTKTFLIFQATSSNNAPTNSSVRCYLTSTSNITCDRDGTVGVVNIAWQTTEFPSGVTVQHLTPVCNVDGDADPNTTNVAITAVSDMAKTFVLYSHKTSGATYDWNDPSTVRLTSTSNVEIRQDSASCAAGSAGALQVVQYTNATVTRGETGAMTGTSLPVTGLSSVTTSKTMLLYSYRFNGGGAAMCDRMVRGQIDSATSLLFTRGDGAAGCTSNPIPAIAWERIEFTDTTSVEQVHPSTAPGIGSDDELISTVATGRTVVFAGGQHTAGQAIGEGSYSGDDVLGAMVARHTLTTDTNLQVVRDNTNGSARWTSYVVQFPSAPSVDITVTVSHTAADGSGPTTIVQSATTRIDSATANPLALAIGNDPTGQTFTSASPRKLRVQINVAAINNGGSFTLAYDSPANPANLDTPVVTVPDWGLAFLILVPLIPFLASAIWRRRRLLAGSVASVLMAAILVISLLAGQVSPVTAAPDTFYLYPTATSGITPAGEYMNTTVGAGSSTKAFDTAGQNAYWYVDQTWPTGGDNGGIAAGTYTLNMYFSQLPGAWYDSNWQFRKQITIDATKVTADLTDFPVLINLSSDTDLGADAQDDGDDILFTSSNGTTKLSHEIERFNGTTGELVAWVKTNLADATNTVLYMYYGNAAAANQQNATGVWDANHKLVMHLSETAAQHQDSTANNNDSTSVVVTTQGSATGKVDGADDFDGVDDFVTIADSASFDIGSGNATWEAWIALDSPNTTYDGVMGHTNGTAATDGWWLTVFQTTGRMNISMNDVDHQSGDLAWTAGTFYFVTWVKSGTTISFYRNGTFLNSVNSGQNINNSAGTFKIGREGSTYDSGGVAFFDGRIDEVRLSNTARSAGWILTGYNNQNSPSTFYSLGSEQTPPSVTITVTVSHTAADGTGDTLITSASTTITSSTADPLALNLGSPSQQTFLPPPASPRRLRLLIHVDSIGGAGSFTLDYNGTCATSRCSNLDTPVVTVPEYGLVFAAVAVLIPVTVGRIRRKNRLAQRTRFARDPFAHSQDKVPRGSSGAGLPATRKGRRR